VKNNNKTEEKKRIKPSLAMLSLLSRILEQGEEDKTIIDSVLSFSEMRKGDFFGGVDAIVSYIEEFASIKGVKVVDACSDTTSGYTAYLVFYNNEKINGHLIVVHERIEDEYGLGTYILGDAFWSVK
jgi:hypothetical protein